MESSQSVPQPMTVDEARAWAAAWKRADIQMSRERQASSRATPIAVAITALDDAFEAAIASRTLRADSGFVEQQQRFKRLRTAQ